MRNRPEFVTSFETEANALLKAKAIKSVAFSRGTYQFEVKDKKELYTPFLTVSDEGRIGDAFCTCADSERGLGCPHLAAAYLQIFDGQADPLHVRFAHSLWNKLFLMCSNRFGGDVDCLSYSNGKYFCQSNTKKPLFSIEATSPAYKKILDSFVKDRDPETEENSIKFFNLTPAEMAEYRAGNPGTSLEYELSFWSDLAKWLMGLGSYEIVFHGQKGSLPQEIELIFPHLKVWFYLSEVSLAEIIPSLATVESPLKVFDEEHQGVEKVEYDPSRKSLVIRKKKEASTSLTKEGIPVGDWLYVEGKGFCRKNFDPILEGGEVPSGKIAEVLKSGALSSLLSLHPESVNARYRLWFDAKYDLHIELYVEEPGDVLDFFPPYAYTKKGIFYPLSEIFFESKEKVVPADQIPEFINRHRLWLNQFPGFQIHLGSLESHLTYHLTPEESLVFEAELNFPEQFDESRSFQEWIYIKGSGFYLKKENRGRLPLHPGLTLHKGEISSFIGSHKEDLEQVQGFFAPQSIIKRMGVTVHLDAEGIIIITPKMELISGVEFSQIKIFGDYVYLKDQGFSEVPVGSRMPERYHTETVIPASQEAAFLAFELEPLRPFIIDIDPQLQKPSHLQLKIRKIQKDRKKRTGEWLVDLIYESELGSIDIFTLFDAFNGRKKHLFSQAGLLSLKDPRFNWLRGISKRRLDRKRGMFRMSTLEWIRLSVFEEVQEPKGTDKESTETRQLLEELQRFESHRLLDISRLKATLRPYQETGLQWLWFLYCHGLSGLLCDDMGLGKTHQTMALLAAIVHEDKNKTNKYLVVCPTSVIYHWQDLLKKFLPELRVCTYYGLTRTVETFEEDYDLLLTSYGIMRTGRDDLRTIQFEAAIFDEIQIAKNSNSQTNLALRGISARMRLGLTGTPIENRIREIKSLIDVVLPGYMPPEAIFRDLFVTPIEKTQDEGKKKLLAKLIKPFILRRKKSEVLLDLPEKIEEISYCDLSAEQKTLYAETAQSLKNTVFSELKDSTKPISYVHVFSALSRLKQICDHPCLLSGEIKKFESHESGKWDLFVQLLDEARNSGQKVVIFSQYLDMLGIIELYLKKKGIGFATIKGSTRDRADQLRKFREDPQCEVFTASLLAAGVGIDLTVASIVIHYDRWWNPAKENQATDRVHRIGQNRGVQVFKLVTKHSIEEHIHDLIERKKGLLEDIVGTDEVDTINYLSRDELIKVFEKIFKEVE